MTVINNKNKLNIIMSETNWNASMQLPTDSDYQNRVTEAIYGPSKSSGNLMITLKAEVIAPDEKEIAGRKVNVSGIPTTNYYTTKIFGDDGQVDVEATKEARRRTFGPSNDPDNPSLYERLGLDGSKVDPENPNMKELVGLCFLSQMTCEVAEQRKTPTAEQVAKAKKAGTKPQGDLMKHPVTGKNLVKYWPKIVEIFGRAPSGAGGNKPY